MGGQYKVGIIGQPAWLDKGLSHCWKFIRGAAGGAIIAELLGYRGYLAKNELVKILTMYI
jgi:hypothetical protein